MRGMSWQRRPELLFHFYPVGDADHLRFIEDALVGGCWALILDGFRTGLEVGLSAPPTRAREGCCARFRPSSRLLTIGASCPIELRAPTRVWRNIIRPIQEKSSIRSMQIGRRLRSCPSSEPPFCVC